MRLVSIPRESVFANLQHPNWSYTRFSLSFLYLENIGKGIIVLFFAPWENHSRFFHVCSKIIHYFLSTTFAARPLFSEVFSNCSEILIPAKIWILFPIFGVGNFSTITIFSVLKCFLSFHLWYVMFDLCRFLAVFKFPPNCALAVVLDVTKSRCEAVILLCLLPRVTAIMSPSHSGIMQVSVFSILSWLFVGT